MFFERKQLRSKLRSLSADLADAAYESTAVRADNEQVRQENHALELSNLRLTGERDQAVAGRDQALIERDNAIAERGRVEANRDEALRELNEARKQRDEALTARAQALEEKATALAQLHKALADRDHALAEQSEAASQMEGALRSHDQMLDERNAALVERDTALQTRRTALMERDEARAEHARVSMKLESTVQELERSLGAQAKMASTYQASLAEQARLSEYVRDGLNRLQSNVMERGCRIRTPYYYLGGGRGLTHLSTGQPFFVATQDRSISPWLLMGGVWETFADDIVTAYVVPGMVIVDVGANMGYYTVKWGSLIGPDGVLHAFEPNPEVLDLLRANVSVNALAFRCHVHPIAAGAAPGRGKLTFNYANLGQAGFDQEHEVERTYEVAIDAIDNVLPSLERVDLFKIDAEGFEPEVLRGASKLISRSPNCAFHIETQPSWERFGTVADILEPITIERRLFIICHNKTLMPIELSQLSGYVRQTPYKMVDLFVCPEAPEFISRVERFVVAKYMGEAEINRQPAVDAPRKARTRKRRARPES